MAKSHFLLLLKQTVSEWWEDNVSRLSAALAYYTVFSIAPLLVIAVRIAAIVFGPDAARHEVSGQLSGLMGQQAADAVETILRKSAAPGSGGRLAAILGGLFFLYAATNLFAELQDSMNTIWDVKLKPTAGWWPNVRRRLLSFAMVLGTGFLLMVSLVMSAALAAGSRYVAHGGEAEARVVNLIASLAISTLLFAAIFKVLPDVNIRWRDVWIGAGVTAALFTLGKFLIGLYLARSSVSSIYGAAGSLGILLIWVYYSAQVLFIGAEFTQVYARRHGRQIEPAPDAISLKGRFQQTIAHTGNAHTCENLPLGERTQAHNRSSWLAPVALIVGFAAGRISQRAVRRRY